MAAVFNLSVLVTQRQVALLAKLLSHQPAPAFRHATATRVRASRATCRAALQSQLWRLRYEQPTKVAGQIIHRRRRKTLAARFANRRGQHAAHAVCHRHQRNRIRFQRSVRHVRKERGTTAAFASRLDVFVEYYLRMINYR